MFSGVNTERGSRGGGKEKKTAEPKENGWESHSAHCVNRFKKRDFVEDGKDRLLCHRVHLLEGEDTAKIGIPHEK